MVLRDGFPVDMRGFSVIRQDSHALQGCLWPRLSSCFWWPWLRRPGEPPRADGYIESSKWQSKGRTLSRHSSEVLHRASPSCVASTSTATVSPVAGRCLWAGLEVTRARAYKNAWVERKNAQPILPPARCSPCSSCEAWRPLAPSSLRSSAYPLHLHTPCSHMNRSIRW